MISLTITCSCRWSHLCPLFTTNCKDNYTTNDGSRL